MSFCYKNKLLQYQALTRLIGWGQVNILMLISRQLADASTSKQTVST